MQEEKFEYNVHTSYNDELVYFIYHKKYPWWDIFGTQRKKDIERIQRKYGIQPWQL